jgi:tetraacyldisaccharide 4'-kinase
LSAVYAAAARRRREWYAARPDERKRLRHPVISIGNIAVGGRGKTPMTATVARMLLDVGETPAVLSRGYARTDPSDGAVVVRDKTGLRADVARSGDEPFMLARQLEGAIVVAGSNRYVSGRLAEHHLGATVHLLDDGFQHFQLDRDADIVLISEADLRDGVTLPSGRLREPPDVLVAADAFVFLDDVDVHVHDVPIFRARRSNGTCLTSEPVFAFAGIAGPQSFFEMLSADGYDVRGARGFADHHPYSSDELERLTAEAKAVGATALLTTEKDYVRLMAYRPFRMPVRFVPLTITPEPEDDFRRWLSSAVAAARDIVIG